MNEQQKNELKRLIMQSSRRGIKENDIILGNFAKSYLSELNSNELGEYENLLNEADQDIYLWISDAAKIPVRYMNIIKKIRNTI